MSRNKNKNNSILGRLIRSKKKKTAPQTKSHHLMQQQLTMIDKSSSQKQTLPFV